MGVELLTAQDRVRQAALAAKIAFEAENAIAMGCVQEAVALRDALIEGDLHGKWLAAGVIDRAIAIEALKASAFMDMIRRRLRGEDRTEEQRAAERKSWPVE